MNLIIFQNFWISLEQRKTNGEKAGFGKSILNATIFTIIFREY